MPEPSAHPFSRRTSWDLRPNALSELRARVQSQGLPLLDLSVSNPSACGLLPQEKDLRELFGRSPSARYRPAPLGALRAREAIASWYEARGFHVDPERILLTASTSEAYSFAFKVLCDPGDRVLVPHPAYPLLDFLTGLDGLELLSIPYQRSSRWSLEEGELFEAEALSARALILVNPNNPTGNYLRPPELRLVERWSQETGAPVIVDEVFGSFPLDAPEPIPRARASDTSSLRLVGCDDFPMLVLDGLSKSCGLPGVKLGWMLLQGPAPFHEEARRRLELVSDTWLSVSTLMEQALPELLELGATLASAIKTRARENLQLLRSSIGPDSPCQLLPVEGGWSVVLRLPRHISEEQWALRLLERDRVLIQPGWFYDFQDEAWAVISLITPTSTLEEGFARILARAEDPDR